MMAEEKLVQSVLDEEMRTSQSSQQLEGEQGRSGPEGILGLPASQQGPGLG